MDTADRMFLDHAMRDIFYGLFGIIILILYIIAQTWDRSDIQPKHDSKYY